MMTRSGLAVLALAASMSLAHAQSGDPAAGQGVYKTDCARCHRTVETIVNRIEGETPQAKSDWLEGFLPDHHLRQADTAADLIAYLLSL